MSEEIKELAEFDTLLGKYWDAAYAEGKEDRAHDTPDNDAARTLAELHRVFKCRYYGNTGPVHTGPVNLTTPVTGNYAPTKTCGYHAVPDGPWYSAEQLAALQAKLEQAEKDKSELVEACKHEHGGIHSEPECPICEAIAKLEGN